LTDRHLARDTDVNLPVCRGLQCRYDRVGEACAWQRQWPNSPIPRRVKRPRRSEPSPQRPAGGLRGSRRAANADIRQALAANPESAVLNRLLESSWQEEPRPHQDRLRGLPGGDRPGSRWPPRGGIGQKSVNESYRPGSRLFYYEGAGTARVRIVTHSGDVSLCAKRQADASGVRNGACADLLRGRARLRAERANCRMCILDG
jgi:hypothetical protein